MFLSELLIKKIEGHCEIDSQYSTAYKKVKGKIRDYANFIKVPIESLLVSHIINHQGTISPNFDKYLNSIETKKKRNQEDKKKYFTEIRSILRRLVSKIIEETEIPVTEYSPNTISSLINSKSLLEKQCPIWLNPVLLELPRDFKNTGTLALKDIARFEYPLTERSSIVLDTILRTIKKHNVTSIEQLIDKKSETFWELREHYYGSKHRTYESDLRDLYKKLGVSFTKKPLTSIPPEEWSPKFKQQIENFIKSTKTESNVKGSSLSRVARKFNIEVNHIADITVETYKSTLAIGLYNCQPLPENWGVEDLLKTDTRIIKVGESEDWQYFNQYVDKYHKLDLEKTSDSKRKGFNSTTFSLFITALRSVAASNGIFELNDRFTQAYPLNLDFESRKILKDIKKWLYSISNIDEQIELLEPTFNRLILKRIFDHNVTTSVTERNRAMRLCIYLPIFVALRFLGVRQKNIRNCQLMLDPENPNYPNGNIGFRKDGTLVIHFQKHETKNRKAIHHEFHPETAGKNFGTLMRVLKLYHDRVYPYIKRNAALPLNRQFFAIWSYKKQGFAPFTCARQFRDTFVRWTNEFMNFRHLTPENYRQLAPHSLRGICADWLFKDCGWTIDEIALYLADNPRTLEREYLDRNRTNDATKIINRENKATSEWVEVLLEGFDSLKQQFDTGKKLQDELERKLQEREAEIEHLKKLNLPENDSDLENDTESG